MSFCYTLPNKEPKWHPLKVDFEENETFGSNKCNDGLSVKIIVRGVFKVSLEYE